ncbi:hypothetical protein [Helicobacter phage DeM53M]|nr:hypothetical protein [Helicobacter phage DeM53M]MCQ2871031.1 hypothetical protein [Helicobacter pylori]
MFNERFLKMIPEIVFLFCILEIFEMVLIIVDMNKTEKLEAKIRNDLEMIEYILNERMQLEHFQDKKIKLNNATEFNCFRV